MKTVIAHYSVVDNRYHVECPVCDKIIKLNLSIEEEMTIDMGYGLNIQCPDCDTEIKVILD